jgi:cell division septation protein DedD
MNTVFKQRMAGAIFILSLGVILIPVILEKPIEQPPPQYSEIPASPGMPETKRVDKIQYVFNQIEENYVAEAEQVAALNSAPAIVAEAAPVASPEVASEISPRLAEQQVISEQDLPGLDPGDWTIQLGAFGSRENADGLRARLAQEGFESYLRDVPGRDLVRVFVAPGIDHDDAEKLLSELNNEMGLKGIIVRFRD